MRNLRKTITLITFLCILSIWIYQFFSQSLHNSKLAPIASPTHSTILGSASAQLTTLPASCHEHDGLPDQTCTPGSINPQVTQENISTTICQRGYTKTIRPPVSYTQELKKQQIIAYGYTDINMRDYEEDHLISLELGGNPTDPKNLWPELGASPNAKDTIENLCHQKVCNGELSLALAQQQIASNWKTACQ